MRKKLISMLLCSSICISFLGTSHIARAVEVDNVDTKISITKGGEAKKYGVKEENEEERQWFKDNVTELKNVELNSLAKKRITEENEKKSVKTFRSYLDLNDETLPEQVDNSTLNSFPDIANQEELGSCVSFSATYYLMSHMVNLFNGLDNPDVKEKKDKVIFSPKWTYNNVNKGMNEGSYQSDTYDFVKQSGAALNEEFMYEGKREPYTNYTMWSTNFDLWKKAQKYSVDEYNYIDFKPVSSAKDSNLNVFKKILCNGYILSMNTFFESTGLAYVGDDKDTNTDDEYVGEEIYRWTNRDAIGEHAVTIVGYNDDIWVDMNGDGEVQDGEKGAFKVANSWGKYMNNKGFFWVSYDAFNEVSSVKDNLLAQEDRSTFSKSAIIMIPKILEEEPRLYAKFTLNTLNRDECNVTLKATSDKESKSFTPYQLDGSKLRGEFSFRGTNEPCMGSFCIDLTKIVPDINSNNLKDYTWTLEVTDKENNNSSVDLKGFAIVDETSDKEYVSDINDNLSANGTTISQSIKPSDSTSSKNIEIKDIRNDKEFRAYTSEEGKEVTLCADVYGGASKKTFIYTIKGNNEEKVINSQNSTVKWTPDKRGDYEINLKVTDSNGNACEYKKLYKVYDKLQIIHSCNSTDVTDGVYNVPINNLFKVNLNSIGGLDNSYIYLSRLSSFWGDFDELKFRENENVIYMIPREENEFGVLGIAKDATGRLYEKEIRYRGYDDGTKTLDSPKNIKIDYLDNINRKISWDEVDGAEGYYIINGSFVLDVVKGNSYTLSDDNYGNYYVMAFNNDKCSRQSLALNMDEIKVENLGDENNTTFITAVLSEEEGDYKYNLKITDRNTGEVIINGTSDSSASKWTPTGSGHYLITVTVVDNVSGSTVSKSENYDLK